MSDGGNGSDAVTPLPLKVMSGASCLAEQLVDLLQEAVGSLLFALRQM